MIINKNEIEKQIEDASISTSSEEKLRYWLGKDEFEGMDELFLDAIISDLTVMINGKLQEYSKSVNFPWIEFAIPYYISETVLSTLCKQYIENGGWYSVRVCRMSVLNEEIINGKKQYQPTPITKFVFTFSVEIDKQVRSFYGEELRNGKWQTIA